MWFFDVNPLLTGIGWFSGFYWFHVVELIGGFSLVYIRSLYLFWDVHSCPDEVQYQYQYQYHQNQYQYPRLHLKMRMALMLPTSMLKIHNEICARPDKRGARRVVPLQSIFTICHHLATYDIMVRIFRRNRGWRSSIENYKIFHFFYFFFV